MVCRFSGTNDDADIVILDIDGFFGWRALLRGSHGRPFRKFIGKTRLDISRLSGVPGDGGYSRG